MRTLLLPVIRAIAPRKDVEFDAILFIISESRQDNFLRGFNFSNPDLIIQLDKM
jgi:hypothetical protein